MRSFHAVGRIVKRYENGHARLTRIIDLGREDINDEAKIGVVWLVASKWDNLFIRGEMGLAEQYMVTPDAHGNNPSLQRNS